MKAVILTDDQHHEIVKILRVGTDFDNPLEAAACNAFDRARRIGGVDGMIIGYDADAEVDINNARHLLHWCHGLIVRLTLDFGETIDAELNTISVNESDESDESEESYAIEFWMLDDDKYRDGPIVTRPLADLVSVTIY